MTTPRHEFYETDEKLTLSIFDRGVDPEKAKITLEPRRFTYENGEKTLTLEPLKGQIDTSSSDFTIGKVKVEVRFSKMVPGRWGGLTGDAPDPLSSSASTPSIAPDARKPPKKNWDGITTGILSSEKEKTTEEDPNAGGDGALNSFFQKMFGDADDDTKRAMMKSYSESGGTTLSTNWNEVKRGKVEVKPPTGSEWKNWG